MPEPKKKSIDEQIEESKKRSKADLTEILDLVDQAPDETVNGMLPDIDRHLEKVRKKCKDLRNGGSGPRNGALQ